MKESSRLFTAHEVAQQMVRLTTREKIDTFAAWFGFRVTATPSLNAAPIPGWPGLFCEPEEKD